MKLAFVYTPVKDLKAALAFYRDLGFEEAWREGELTAAVVTPGAPVPIMLDQDDTGDGGPGPFFVVDDVPAFYDANKDRLAFVAPPRKIPPGMYAAFEDPSGNVVRVMDTSADRA